MSTLTRLVTSLTCAVLVAISTALPVYAQSNSLTIGYPRAEYNGWMSNQTGVTETLMGIDYEMKLYPRVAESVDQASPTQWRVTLREGVKFHDGTG